MFLVTEGLITECLLYYWKNQTTICFFTVNCKPQQFLWCKPNLIFKLVGLISWMSFSVVKWAAGCFSCQISIKICRQKLFESTIVRLWRKMAALVQRSRFDWRRAEEKCWGTNWWNLLWCPLSPVQRKWPKFETFDKRRSQNNFGS